MQDKDKATYLENFYSNTRIATRYLAIPDFCPEQKEDGDENFFLGDGTFSIPIEVRLNKYRELAIPLVTDVCRRAVNDSGISMSNIHKLVVVSSTGFLGPSLDCELIKALNLPKTTDRSLVGFMGCAAALNGFRIAMDFVKAHPGQHALMVCVEISSIHSTFKGSMNETILHAIFSDGAAACVISGENYNNVPNGSLVIADDHGMLMDGTDDGIILSINKDGISCTLSKFLPTYIAKNIGNFVDAFLQKNNFNRNDVDFWAIHPGGRRIIEEAQNGLGVSSEQASESWEILNKYGNMLSPSVLFVLEKVFLKHKDARLRGENGYNMGLAFSFSPGVGVEGIMLKQIK
jgi:alpha-pyrone synthase